MKRRRRKHGRSLRKGRENPREPLKQEGGSSSGKGKAIEGTLIDRTKSKRNMNSKIKREYYCGRKEIKEGMQSVIKGRKKSQDKNDQKERVKDHSSATSLCFLISILFSILLSRFSFSSISFQRCKNNRSVIKQKQELQQKDFMRKTSDK